MTAGPRTEARYHVPMSQVWGGSRGAAEGCVHLHVTEELRSGRLVRAAGRALCGKKRGWYERRPEDGERRCPRCEDMSKRHDVEWPVEGRSG